MLVTLDWGADRTTMLRLYRSIIRSKIDYGCFIYSTAKLTILQTLDPVHNSASRLCTGAFRSSPVDSLYAETGEPPLEFRRNQLLIHPLCRFRAYIEQLSQGITAKKLRVYIRILNGVTSLRFIQQRSGQIYMKCFISII